MTLRIAVPFALAVAIVSAVACSSSSSSGSAAAGNGQCNSNPGSCAAGTVCWPIDNVPNFNCLPSKPIGVSGTQCLNTTNVPTCTDGNACVEVTANAYGICEPYCDPNAPDTCPQGGTCKTLFTGPTTNFPTISVCVPPPGVVGTVPDAGTSSDGGGSSSGGPTDSGATD